MMVGEFQFDIRSGKTSQFDKVRFSDYDEDQSVKVIRGTNEDTNWIPPEAPIAMPDYSKVEHLKKYFGKRPHSPYPAWVYHEDGDKKLVKTHDEAVVLGIFYRKASNEEKGRYGVDAMWDWQDGCKWRPNPWPVHLKFDAKAGDNAKNIIRERPDASDVNRDLVTRLVRELFADKGPKAPEGFSKEDLEEFRKFQAFKNAEKLGNIAEEKPAENALSASLSTDDEWKLWSEEAERVGVTVDRRWSIETLKRKVEEASE